MDKNSVFIAFPSGGSIYVQSTQSQFPSPRFDISVVNGNDYEGRLVLENKNLVELQGIVDFIQKLINANSVVKEDRFLYLGTPECTAVLEAYRTNTAPEDRLTHIAIQIMITPDECVANLTEIQEAEVLYGIEDQFATVCDRMTEIQNELCILSTTPKQGGIHDLAHALLYNLCGKKNEYNTEVISEAVNAVQSVMRKHRFKIDQLGILEEYDRKTEM